MDHLQIHIFLTISHGAVWWYQWYHRQKGSRSFYCNMNSNARWRSPKRTRRLDLEKTLHPGLAGLSGNWCVGNFDGNIIPILWEYHPNLMVFISSWSYFPIYWEYTSHFRAPLKGASSADARGKAKNWGHAANFEVLSSDRLSVSFSDRRAGQPLPQNWIAKDAKDFSQYHNVPHMTKNCGYRKLWPIPLSLVLEVVCLP